MERLRERRFVTAIRVAVGGSAEEVDTFLDGDARAGRPGDFDSVEAILAASGKTAEP